MSRIARALVVVLAAIAALASAACGGKVPAAEFGERLFNDARLSDSRINTFSCGTCHSTKAEPDEDHLYAGYTLHNALGRPSYWGGQQTRLIDAASFCLVYFMRGSGPLDPSEPKSKALYEYLHSLSPDPTAEALPMTVVQDISDVPGGDAKKGEAVYRRACQACHGAIHTGSGRLTPLASVLPEIKNSYDQEFPGVAPRLVFIEKVRHGQFFGVGGNMPLYSKETLTDEQLADLLAYLGL